MSKSFFLLIAFGFCVVFDSSAQVKKKNAITIHVDGSKQFQRIDGIGVNANTRSWDDDKLKPALNLLMDTLNASIWRVIVETVEKWEEVNDNDDPFSFNWDYYNKLYETPKFEKAWSLIQYLNQHGVTNNLMINFMGFAPKWMGVKVINPAFEDEYVEMIASFFYYALKNRQLKFGLIAPTNESDHHGFSEGPHLNGKQHARIIRKLIDRMENLGIMEGIRIVAPDNADINKSVKDFLPPLLEDSVIMSKMGPLAFHSYGGYNPAINNFISNSTVPNKDYWVTEWNAWCNGCDEGKLGEYNYQFAGKSVGYLLDFLNNGATACLAWEAYDSYYEHHAPSLFSYWGMLGYDSSTSTYFPRKNFYAIQHVSRFVQPGSRRIKISATDSLSLTAFRNDPLGKAVIVGINHKKEPVSINCQLLNLATSGRYKLYYTNSRENLRQLKLVKTSRKTAEWLIPADCIFTIVADIMSVDLSEQARLLKN